MSEHLTKPRFYLPLAAFIVAAVAVLILSIAPSPPRAMARSEPVVDAKAVESLMARLGATPQTLAAAGLTSVQAGAVVGFVDAFLDANIAGLAEADADVAAARQSVRALQRKARAGLASPQELTDLAAARTTLSTAEAELAAILASATDAAYADLDNDQKAVLAAVQNAGMHQSLGVPICAAERTESEWVEIRRAAGAVRSAEFNGEDPDAEALTVLENAAGHADAVEAQANIDVRLDGVNAAVATALSGV